MIDSAAKMISHERQRKQVMRKVETMDMQMDHIERIVRLAKEQIQEDIKS